MTLKQQLLALRAKQKAKQAGRAANPPAPAKPAGKPAGKKGPSEAELRAVIAAERLRLARARGLLFWGFLFVPIVSLAFGLMGTLITVATRRAPNDPGLAFAANDLAKAASEAMTQTDLIPVQLFFMLAAAGLVADDYRWETWRLVTPRNTRTNLLLAKLMTFGLGAAGSILLIAVLSMVGALIRCSFASIFRGTRISPNCLALATIGSQVAASLHPCRTRASQAATSRSSHLAAWLFG